MSDPLALAETGRGRKGFVGPDVSLLGWIARRLAFSILVLFVLSLLIFIATAILPGEAGSRLGYSALLPANIKAAVVERLGLDRPAHEMYLSWLGGVLRFDMGESIISQRPVWPLVSTALGHSLFLGGLAVLVIVPLSVLLGTLSALNRGRWPDRIISAITLGGLSVPEFVTGSILVWLFAVVIPLFPSLYLAGAFNSPWDQAKSLVLPVLTLTPIIAGYMTKTMRSSMMNVLSEDYILMASFKGLSRRRVILRHALPNALIPMVNIFALNLGWLVGGMVVVEIIFAYPGIGRLLLDAINSKDLTVLQGAALMMGSIYVGLNLIADIIVFVLDPRIRRRSLG